jgi:hypothetical protein
MSTSAMAGKIRKLALGGALIVAAAAPLAVALPAEAATSSGCTVTPLQPVFAGFNSSGTKLVRFSVNVSCAADRTVYIQQQRYEEDWDGWLFDDSDDSLGTVSFTRTFAGAASTTVSSIRTLPNTEDGNEETYVSMPN